MNKTHERFLSRIKIDEDSACWEWQAGKAGQSSYGRFFADGKQQRAHRYSWEYYSGRKIPKGMLVLHKCANPICVSPAHLNLGTHKDNVRDAIERGRTVQGEKNNFSKFTEDQVRLIRSLYKGGGITQPELARVYGVHTGTIHALLRRGTWRHI